MMNLPVIVPEDNTRAVVTECGQGTRESSSSSSSTSTIENMNAPTLIVDDEDGDDTALDLLLRDDSSSSKSSTSSANRSNSERHLLVGHSGSHPMDLRRVVSEDVSPSSSNKENSVPPRTPSDPLSFMAKPSSTTEKTLVSPVSKEDNANNAQQNTLIKTSTPLFTLILIKKYREANRRLREHPDEASTWVAAKEWSATEEEEWKASKLIAPSRSLTTLTTHHTASNNNNNNTNNNNKCLPIHIACANLATASESTERYQLEQLILKLILSFPDGCSRMDRNGQSPLLLAIWNNATPETISMLLMADPSSIYHRDPCGRTAAEVNRHRCGIFVEQVKDLLAMGVDFWKAARQKAADKFHQSLNFTATTVSEQASLTSAITEDGYPDSSLTVDDEEETYDDHNDDATESLLSETFPTLLQRQAQLASIFRSPEQETLCRSHELELPLRSSNIHTPLSTTASKSNTKELDPKTSILQDMLSEMYEKNQRLSTTINELSQINSDLNKKIEGNNNSNNKPNTSFDSELLRQVQDLQKERDELLQMVAKQQDDDGAKPCTTIQEVRSEEEADRPFDEKAQDSVCSASRTASRHDIIALKTQNKALKQKIARLKSKKNKQSEKIEYLKSIVACTRDDLLTDLSLETESESTFSMLDSITTNPTNAEKADDHSSTASSFRRRLAASAEKAAESTKESMERECLITGLASYRFREFVSRLQRTVCPPKDKKAQDPTADSDLVETDDVDKICSVAAELYSQHVQEHPWRDGELILQWEPPAFIRAAPAMDVPAHHVDRNLNKAQPSPRQQLGAIGSYDREVPMVIPVRYRVAEINNELGSIISYSETSLSSIGMNSLSDNLWI